MLFNAFLAMALRTLLVWENKKLDERYGTVHKRKIGEVDGEENEGPGFRYIL